MKKQILHDYYCQIMAWNICDGVKMLYFIHFILNMFILNRHIGDIFKCF
jgi:hypothetical protein